MSHRTVMAPDEPTSRLLRLGLVLGGLSGALGVALMAMSAHMDTTGLMKTAAEMLLFHAPALVALGLIAQVRRVPLLPFAWGFLALGLTLFCGDLISRALTEHRLFPMAAPTGGMFLIGGWLTVFLAALRISAR
jgi:uncharacterized membrane protein YgdD (TMEM256/DUF423 family)